MSNLMSVLLFSLLFFLISVASFNATHKCSPQQTLDLLLFKENMSSINLSFGNPPYYSPCQDWLGSSYYHPIMMNWNKNTDCCKWDGITCNHITGDVIGIDVSCGMIQGTIHANTTLFHLPHLQTLNLAYNHFTGSQLARLSNSLKHVNISRCGFTGEITSEISFPPYLESLDLSGNNGLQMQPYVLKSLLQNSTHLRELLIYEVVVGGALPTHLNIPSSLKSLDLSYTGLQGKLPDNIFNLQYLEKLHLKGNSYLSGPFPKVNTSINIPLKWLDLSFTNLSGEIPDSIGHLKSLNHIGLSSCGLVGFLPNSLVNLRFLTSLYLYRNMLKGTLPSFLFALPFLENLYLGSNMFSGGLPSLFSCRSLKRLSLDDNRLDGKITLSSFIQLTNLTRLGLSSNNFTGLWELEILLSSLPSLESLRLSDSGLSVVSKNSSSYVNPDISTLGLASCKLTLFPESLRAMKNLMVLDVSNNSIRGYIPDWAGEIGRDSLDYLDLSYNSITGLPQFQYWDRIQYLYLQSNQIQGPFPPSICNLTNLISLDLSNNRFSGVIPQCLGDVSPSLQYLNVKANFIQGQLPQSICNLSGLMFLDISNNSFGGAIPQCLGSMIGSYLAMADMGNNHFHGPIPHVYQECGGLEGLILKGNQLQGEVPSSLAKCQSLKVLDLGNNQLNGPFPPWLADLPMLQVLVLKSNKLRGPIDASSTFTNAFSSMKVLDLSHNGFVGHLPQKYLHAMKNLVKNSTRPKYLSVGGNSYSVTPPVKGVEQEIPQILVDYTIVDLSNNRFEGEIPGVIGSLTSLILLDLSHNNLTGQIPSVLGNLSEIESLDLSWNQLTGEIPQSLGELTSLGFLNLSQNHLVGRIPRGRQLGKFGTSSFGGNPELCGVPLPKKCEHAQEKEVS